MQTQIRMSSTLFALICITVFVQSSLSMPNFARRYNLGCASCHAGVPRLNEFGFKFRAAGFRLPDEVGKGETSANIGDYIAARTQARFDYKTSDVPITGGSTTASNTQLTFHEITFYPITGAFGKNYSSLVEMSFLPDEAAELENAYVRYNKVLGNNMISIRGGIFHPFEGYGASDRPLSLSRPLFQTTTANNGVSTIFKPWGFDEVGVEFGYIMEHTNIRLTIFNGLLPTAEPAQGGALSKAVSDPSRDSKDVQLFVNHALTEDGGGVSGYAYFGFVDLPGPPLAKNYFQRFALYASYPVKRALLLAGFQQGTDYPTAANSFSSQGFFGEADYSLSELLWVGARFDSFDPSTDKSDNEQFAVTAFANYYLDDGLQFIGEYQNKSTKKGTVGTQKDNAFQIRMIFIF